MTASRSHHVVIVGGGFGGLQAALALGRSPVTVTLIDQRNFHIFQPLLYQVATGALSPANIASPLRALVRDNANTRVMLAVAVGLDADRNILRLSDGSVSYDSLIIAAGARHHYFGHPEWEPNAPGLKTIEDATNMRRRIFSAFEAAEREDDPSRRDALLTFVVVGGGPTGLNWPEPWPKSLGTRCDGNSAISTLVQPGYCSWRPDHGFWRAMRRKPRTMPRRPWLSLA